MAVGPPAKEGAADVGYLLQVQRGVLGLQIDDLTADRLLLRPAVRETAPWRPLTPPRIDHAAGGHNTPAKYYTEDSLSARRGLMVAGVENAGSGFSQTL